MVMLFFVKMIHYCIIEFHFWSWHIDYTAKYNLRKHRKSNAPVTLCLSNFTYYFCHLLVVFKINIFFFLGGGGRGRGRVKQFGSDQAQHLGLGEGIWMEGGRMGKGGELDVRILHITYYVILCFMIDIRYICIY